MKEIKDKIIERLESGKYIEIFYKKLKKKYIYKKMHIATYLLEIQYPISGIIDERKEMMYKADTEQAAAFIDLLATDEDMQKVLGEIVCSIRNDSREFMESYRKYILPAYN